MRNGFPMLKGHHGRDCVSFAAAPLIHFVMPTRVVSVAILHGHKPQYSSSKLVEGLLKHSASLRWAVSCAQVLSIWIMPERHFRARCTAHNNTGAVTKST